MLKNKRLQDRNNYIKKQFTTLTTKNHNLRTYAVIEAIAAKLFLSPNTVESVIKSKGWYK